MKELTWQEVWCMYDHAQAWIAGKDVDYDEEPEPLTFKETKIVNGARIYSK